MEKNVNTAAQKLFELRGEMGPLPLDGYNPHFGSRYTLLSTVISRLNPLLKKYRLLLLQDEKLLDDKIVVRTRVHDVDTGDEVAFNMETPTVKTPVKTKQGEVIPGEYAAMNHQAVAAVMSYFRRIEQILVANAPQDDDDGAAAAGLPAVQSGSAAKHAKKDEPLPEL